MLKLKRGVIVSEVPQSDQTSASNSQSILDFWFTPEPGSAAGKTQSRWFVPDPAFDRLCEARFLSSYEDAACGRLDDWKNRPRSCLALVLLLDQFPRNMFRNTARAFATDAKAREMSRPALASGFDRELSPLMRMFLYLPLEHSENLEDQWESVRLTSTLAAENPDQAGSLNYAEQHLEVIRRFGRFPGRNRALQRQTTKEEMDFLTRQS